MRKMHMQNKSVRVRDKFVRYQKSIFISVRTLPVFTLPAYVVLCSSVILEYNIC